MCSDFCRRKTRHRQSKAKPLCSVSGCRNHRGYANPPVCNSCYRRLRRTGTLEKPAPPAHRSLCTTGYIRIFKKSHPLANKQGWVFEHRAVLYDAIGPGPHQCHWCKCSVDWIKGRCVKGSLVPDHLDGDRANNALSNLVPACNPCNAARGLFMAWLKKHIDDPVIAALYRDAVRERGETA